jgi:hypothetical protein
VFQENNTICITFFFSNSLTNRKFDTIAYLLFKFPDSQLNGQFNKINTINGIQVKQNSVVAIESTKLKFRVVP